MRKINKIVFFASTISVMQSAKAQTPPAIDAAWQVQSAYSDGFNSSPLNSTKWWDGGTSSPNGWAAEVDKNANLSLTGTTLKIKANTLSPTELVPNSTWHTPTSSSHVYYAYQGAGIRSQSMFKYGYFEISATYPTGYYPLWPAFWLWSQNCSSPIYYNEIDICENGGVNSYDGHKMGTNVHLNSGNDCGNDTQNGQDITSLPLLSSAFHKYAIEWSPDRIIWYFDDSPVRTLYDASHATIPQYAMYAIMNIAIDPWHATLDLNDWNNIPGGQNPLTVGSLSSPQYFEINYFNYYTLNTSGCGTNLTICTPSTDYSNRGVEKTITTTGCTPTFNTSSGYTLRATDSVTLDVGATVNDDGSGYFAIDVIACPQ